MENDATGAYDGWRDDCATELCVAVDALVAEVIRDKKSYFNDQPWEAMRCIEVHARAQHERLSGERSLGR
jgi:hypothetical protein